MLDQTGNPANFGWLIWTFGSFFPARREKRILVTCQLPSAHIDMELLIRNCSHPDPVPLLFRLSFMAVDLTVVEPGRCAATMVVLQMRAVEELAFGRLRPWSLGCELFTVEAATGYGIVSLGQLPCALADTSRLG